MHELINYQFNTRRKKYGTGAALSLLNGNVGREVLAFHKKLPNYAVTPLHNLAHL
ncbi:diaminopropionate ammonia-lyase, partial [Salmonella enterica]|nr:diaminopropionate ammonia-lyase [Salmonella enterica]